MGVGLLFNISFWLRSPCQSSLASAKYFISTLTHKLTHFIPIATSICILPYILHCTPLSIPCLRKRVLWNIANGTQKAKAKICPEKLRNKVPIYKLWNRYQITKTLYRKNMLFFKNHLCFSNLIVVWHLTVFVGRDHWHCV